MRINSWTNGFEIVHNGKQVLCHSYEKPLLFVGTGQEDIEMYRGNFKIEDYVTERMALRNFTLKEHEDGILVDFGGVIEMRVEISEEELRLKFKSLDAALNRFWIRLSSDEEEHLYGLGEQMSHFSLRGKDYPIWTSEPGVGRNKNTYITWRSDVENKAGGDYYNSNYPEPTYVSSRHYYVHVRSTAYSKFNFKNPSFHEIEVWEVPEEISIVSAVGYLPLLEKLTEEFGRQPELPDWIYNGLIIGAQGGTERSFGILDQALDKGIQVSGLWCQDWVGKKVTSFGKRLRWNWVWDEEMYPDLPQKMKEYKEKGIRFLGYINPYILEHTELYREGLEKGYFAKTFDDEEYLVDFGEFYCGVVDFTNPDAFSWFKDIIKKNLIDFGLDGWMADFGEYLPTDLKLYNGKSAMIEHNHWPVLWAKCNYDAVVESGKLGEIVYFMRAGGNGTQKYCPLLWAGDQSVDFSIDDGLASVICGTLSSAMVGNGINHSDIGGYTSLFDNIRTKELFLRWSEMGAFTPVMRTHEGNRPETNFQFYEDEDTMVQLARLTTIYTSLKEYLKEAVKENHAKGTPVQRPLFLHYENDSALLKLQTQYLLGRDLMVAPVYLEGAETREVYLPEDEWIHLWTGKSYGQGTYSIDTPMGYPAVFYRKTSPYNTLFERIGTL